MNTIFDKEVRAELIARIEKITTENKAEWGRMNLYQMLKHNTYWNGWILGNGNHTYKQEFLGKIFGKMALKRMIKNDKPFDRNIPTSDQFKVIELTGDMDAEKAKWISLINEYEKYNNPTFVHDFFGKMNKEQIGILVYKHTDHHLRQFGA
jgi:hypothetical protein